ncbi:MAG: nucleotidyltransferase domain-containing protein [Candidatus Kerfeldbacteria bacterium]|nr:nucleotidyltransferase domain-containing protein [Candidatus Kerfeldbacteria bacterium]
MNDSQKIVIGKITEILDQDSRVLAAWLEGSLARKEEDDCSDIDLWISVKDKYFDEFIDEREAFAAKVGSVLSVLYPKTFDQPDELDSFQVIFEDQPLTLTLDVDVQKHTRKFRFTKDSAAQECKVLFDKGGVIEWKPFNPVEVETYAREVFDDVVLRFWHRLPKVLAYAQRNDFLEAMAQYMQRLEELVTLYRVLYTPEKVDWGFKDIEYDLPEEEVKAVYELLPTAKMNARTIKKDVHHLAKTFAKFSHTLSKRLHAELPEALSERVLKEL